MSAQNSCAARPRRLVQTPPFRAAGGGVASGSIAEVAYRRLGGLDQWVMIRGEKVANPPLILLHGGPGFSETAFFRYFNAPLERDFTVVYWDQRGAGKSYDPSIPRASMTVEQFISDLDNLVDVVRERLAKPKVAIFGHSWGSVLGALYAGRFPEKVLAYIGSGQIGDWRSAESGSYHWALAEARRRGNRRALRKLEALGPPPYSADAVFTERTLVSRFEGQMRPQAMWKIGRAILAEQESSILELPHGWRGFRFSMDAMWPQVSRLNLLELSPALAIPVFFLIGRHDHFVPPENSVAYFDALTAPSKEIVWFEHSGHEPFVDEANKFNAAMTDLVRPAVAPRRSAGAIRSRGGRAAADTARPAVAPATAGRCKRAGAAVEDVLKLAGAIATGPVSRRPVRPIAGEADRPLPGDEAVSGARVRWTHAITIAAPPAEIWPWLLQMGCGRAGWYSYDGLDNAGMPSADHIIPELQHAKIGDVFPMKPGSTDSFVVRAIAAERSLVLADAGGSAGWTFLLEPLDEARARLVTRSTGSYKHLMGGLLLEVLLRPIHFGMQRQQLLNLRRLAESNIALPHGRSGPDTLKLLVGSGHKIGATTVPFLLVGLGLNRACPRVFRVGGPARRLRVMSAVTLTAGILTWMWSVVLILSKVPRGELISSGPYRLVKHPLYTGVALLVLPPLGFLLNTWLGAPIGVVLYLSSRHFSPEEEAELLKTFGPAWNEYCKTVKLPWL